MLRAALRDASSRNPRTAKPPKHSCRAHRRRFTKHARTRCQRQFRPRSRGRQRPRRSFKPPSRDQPRAVDTEPSTTARYLFVFACWAPNFHRCVPTKRANPETPATAPPIAAPRSGCSERTDAAALRTSIGPRCLHETSAVSRSPSRTAGAGRAGVGRGGCRSRPQHNSDDREHRHDRNHRHAEHQLRSRAVFVRLARRFG